MVISGAASNSQCGVLAGVWGAESAAIGGLEAKPSATGGKGVCGQSLQIFVILQ